MPTPTGVPLQLYHLRAALELVFQLMLVYQNWSRISTSAGPHHLQRLDLHRWKVVNFIFSNYIRSHRPKGVQTFTYCPLIMFLTPKLHINYNISKNIICQSFLATRRAVY